MKKFFTLLSLLFLLNSCSLASIGGLSDDYNKLTDEQKSMVVSFEPDQPTDKNKIYVINAVELRTELKKYPKALVYTFANGCSSEFCKPLYVYENWAKKNDYKLFLVMTSYFNLDYTLAESFQSQLYVMDSNYFGKQLARKYVGYFQNELKGLKYNAKEDWNGGLFFFKNGEFVNNLNELPKN